METAENNVQLLVRIEQLERTVKSLAETVTKLAALQGDLIKVITEFEERGRADNA